MQQPPHAAHPPAFDRTPKKDGAAAGLEDSSASPVSVIPKNTRRRGGAPELARAARGQLLADKKLSPAGKGTSMPHPSSRILGVLRGDSVHHYPEGVDSIAHS